MVWATAQSETVSNGRVSKSYHTFGGFQWLEVTCFKWPSTGSDKCFNDIQLITGFGKRDVEVVILT
jgi:hypothetical protein